MVGAKRVGVRAAIALCMLVGMLFFASCDSSSRSGGLLGGRDDLSSEVPVDSESRANPGSPRDNTPVVMTATQPAVLVMDSEHATLDYSNVADGYVCVRNNMASTKLMVVINTPDGKQYKYSITEPNLYITLPMSSGNGTYQLVAYRNVYGDSYSTIFTQSFDVALNDEFAPYLYSNYYANFSDGDQATELSAQLSANATSDVEAVEQIYSYVIQNLVYDYEKAETVAPGYHPNNDSTLATKDGICFDYASLVTSMFRAQRMPTKLDVGYCGQAYHAWIEVYTQEAGWVRKEIDFPGSAYVRMDPTFDSADKSNNSFSIVVGDGKTYQTLFYY